MSMYELRQYGPYQRSPVSIALQFIRSEVGTITSYVDAQSSIAKAIVDRTIEIVHDSHSECEHKKRILVISCEKQLCLLDTEMEQRRKYVLLDDLFTPLTMLQNPGIVDMIVVYGDPSEYPAVTKLVKDCYDIKRTQILFVSTKPFSRIDSLLENIQ